MFATIDTVSLRQEFPSLQQQVDGRTALFLDAPGGTQVPQSVIDAMMGHLIRDNSNQGGTFITSQRTDNLVGDARRAVADMINAHRREEIVFGPNMTTLAFALSRALSRDWEVGDEIIVSRLDHDANISPWIQAAEERGVVVHWLDIDPADCTLHLRQLKNILSDKCRLLALTHASNAVGTIVDVAPAIALAHEAGALVCVDAVHYAPHRMIDVAQLDCDFLFMSAYKFFGPHVGIMYGKYGLLNQFKPANVVPASSLPPGKWETGTLNFEGLAGIRAVVDYLATVGKRYGNPAAREYADLRGRRLYVRLAFDLIQLHENMLAVRFLEGLRGVNGITIYGITDPADVQYRVPTFALRLDGKAPRFVARKLAELGIFVWDGHFYALRLAERLGVLPSGGFVRIGFAHYNTIEEVDQVVAALKRLAD